mmetsp:Transcript_7215/g.7917  ORF Transcript_7215/g.7917 Transcript_7215/m.7917 type:complete len:90 (-) Transcript_7215:139-408(-)|eukprot:CAMPEP_0168517648 /NCGR_PEP_ID=MMETSP0405-20121227/6181_1 /TAXON_ID=498012 /ORGANISM="Trichosphaerium sp, Strain Am-I-7 wt" /LENGTH=89 /DNA_ID=CAMNT_0008537707 /DNA_START=183 /DNA_END=452 /DNA_ORIENTATION=-
MASNYSYTNGRSQKNSPVNVKEEEPKMTVDLSVLDLQSLRVYKRKNRLKTRSNPTKQELIDAATEHFRTWEMPSDYEVLDNFLYNARFT